jgi:hypothetical protein
MRSFRLILIAGAATVATLAAQDVQRRAEIGREAPGGAARCVVSVVVDGSAEIQIRGDSATLHNLAGAPGQFRQFVCSRPMPPNARELQFRPVEGRGRQEMISAPRDGGPAVIHIEDPEGGAGEYRFELTWVEGGPERGRPAEAYRGGEQRPGGDQYQEDRDRFFQGESWRRNFFQRVREDVEHLEHSTIPFTGDRARLTRTANELNELQGKLAQGRYDERQLDDVMAALSSVVQNNRLSERDRDILNDDLRRMREFRERHDEWGARRYQ